MAYVERSGTGYWAGCGWATRGQALIVVRSRVREKREGRREGREDVQVADGSEKSELLVGTLYLSLGLIDDAIRGACMFKLH